MYFGYFEKFIWWCWCNFNEKSPQSIHIKEKKKNNDFKVFKDSMKVWLKGISNLDWKKDEGGKRIKSNHIEDDLKLATTFSVISECLYHLCVHLLSFYDCYF